MKANLRHHTLVPALDVLISDPDIINPEEKDNPKKANRLIIPYGYLTRIDNFYNEASTRGDSCNDLMHHFSTMKLNLDHTSENGHFNLPNGTRIEFRDTDESDFRPKGLNPDSTKAQAIIAAKMIKESVAIWTGSDRQIPFTVAHGVNIARVNAEVYTGRRKVNLSFENSGAWHSSSHGMPLSEWLVMYPKESPLRPNEFVEFSYEGALEKSDEDQKCYIAFDPKSIGRFDAKSETIVPLKYPYSMRYGLHPRTPGQAMLCEALLSSPDEIPLVIVSGVFGTGKTFLTVANGLAQVEKNGKAPIYESVFVCPRDGNLGRDIGALPGDKYGKIIGAAAPITDNLREVLVKKGRDKAKGGKTFNDSDDNAKRYFDNAVTQALEQYFEFEALIFMGGRSLSRRFIIYDEFQDMERGQAKAILRDRKSVV